MSDCLLNKYIQILISKINIVDSDSEDSEDSEESEESTNEDTNITQQDKNTEHDIGLNSDITDVESISQIPSSSHNSAPFQMPNLTKRMMNISFLCNPNDEDVSLRQPSVSELFGDNLSSVQKRSWAKDSTSEHVHLSKPIYSNIRFR